MAYKSYQYETSPRKLKPEYETIKKQYPKKSTARKTRPKEEKKINKKTKAKVIFYIVMCFSALLLISLRYSQIDDTYAHLKVKKEELALLEKEATQLEANIESSLNLEKIEKEAKEMLGMQKLKGDQVVVLTLPKKEHVETSVEEVKSTEESGNWLQQFINEIIQKLK